MGAATLWAAGGFPALRECFLPLLVMSSVTAGVQLIGVTVGVWNIAAMLGALAGLLVGSLWALSRNTRAPSFSPALLRKALLPYALILLLIFAANGSCHCAQHSMPSPYRSRYRRSRLRAAGPRRQGSRGGSPPSATPVRCCSTPR
jgi:hypothetical protein